MFDNAIARIKDKDGKSCHLEGHQKWLLPSTRRLE
jgi:hypothetical protein